MKRAQRELSNILIASFCTSNYPCENLPALDDRIKVIPSALTSIYGKAYFTTSTAVLPQAGLKSCPDKKKL